MCKFTAPTKPEPDSPWEEVDEGVHNYSVDLYRSYKGKLQNLLGYKKKDSRTVSGRESFEM